MSTPKSFQGFYRVINGPEDWKPLLAEPEKHWRTGYSAKTLAYIAGKNRKASHLRLDNYFAVRA